MARRRNTTRKIDALETKIFMGQNKYMFSIMLIYVINSIKVILTKNLISFCLTAIA